MCRTEPLNVSFLLNPWLGRVFCVVPNFNFIEAQCHEGATHFRFYSNGLGASLFDLYTSLLSQVQALTRYPAQGDHGSTFGAKLSWIQCGKHWKTRLVSLFNIQHIQHYLQFQYVSISICWLTVCFVFCSQCWRRRKLSALGQRWTWHSRHFKKEIGCQQAGSIPAWLKLQ